MTGDAWPIVDDDEGVSEYARLNRGDAVKLLLLWSALCSVSDAARYDRYGSLSIKDSLSARFGAAIGGILIAALSRRNEVSNWV